MQVIVKAATAIVFGMAGVAFLFGDVILIKT